jgi:hypothetical protein
MKKKSMVLALLLMGLVVSGCSQGTMATRPSGPPPMITNFYCADQGPYGDTLKIYVAADDPAGDMERIAVVINQVGYGPYFTDWIYLKPQFQKKFVGYLMWDTGTGARVLPPWTKITINVTVYDRAGNQSNAVILPHTFTIGGPTNLPMPSIFSHGNVPRLGYVDVNLVNPQAPMPM